MPFRKGYIFAKYMYAKFRENKTFAKSSESTVSLRVWGGSRISGKGFYMCICINVRGFALLVFSLFFFNIP